MIQHIIRLLDNHPLEWTFENRPSWEKEQILRHKDAGLAIRLRFRYSGDKEPTWVELWHAGADIGWWEHRKLLAAVKRIQRRRFDAMAAKYLEGHRPPCYHCDAELVCIKCDWYEQKET